MCYCSVNSKKWAREYTGILLQAGLRIPLLGGYVDNGRQGSTTLRRGMVFDEKRKEFVFDEEQKRIDDERMNQTTRGWQEYASQP